MFIDQLTSGAEMKELSYRKYLQCSLLVYCLDLYLLTDDTGFASQFHWTVNPFTATTIVRCNSGNTPSLQLGSAKLICSGNPQ